MNRTIPVNVSAKSVYLFHPTGHYDLVGCTVKVPSEPNLKKISRVALSLVTQNPSMASQQTVMLEVGISGLMLHTIFSKQYCS